MSKNRFYTVMVVPEKQDNVKKIVVPAFLFRGAIVFFVILTALAIIMILDYANVMSQINENKQLRIENRQLKQQVHLFKDKMTAMDNTVDRVRIFLSKLKVITNIDNAGLVPANPPPNEKTKKSSSSDKNETSGLDPKGSSELNTDDSSIEEPSSPELQKRKKRKLLLASLQESMPDHFTLTDSDSSLALTEEFQKLDDAYNEVNQYALSTEKDTQALFDSLAEKRTLLATTPTITPTLGHITSEYGVRINPIEGKKKMHEGIDIANRLGSDIYASADGVISFSGTKPGYGKLVIIDHGNGLETYYAHNARLLAQLGSRVKRGQTIATVGNSGHSTGPHCHYEVRANGLPVDPCWYILDNPDFCKQSD